MTFIITKKVSSLDNLERKKRQSHLLVLKMHFESPTHLLGYCLLLIIMKNNFKGKTN